MFWGVCSRWYREAQDGERVIFIMNKGTTALATLCTRRLDLNFMGRMGQIPGGIWNEAVLRRGGIEKNETPNTDNWMLKGPCFAGL